MFLGFFALASYQQTKPIEQAATRFMRAYPGQIEFDAQAKGTLMLVPGVLDAPLAPAGQPLRMTIQSEECRSALVKSLSAGRISLEGEVVLGDQSSLCLVRYR
jgi:hypothetical protein